MEAERNGGNDRVPRCWNGTFSGFNTHNFGVVSSKALNGGTMNRQRRFATWTGAALGTVCALFALSLAARASDRLTEEFHKTYPISATGRVELDNINGDVHISSWDRNEVKVDAIKTAGTKERLDEARIE